MRKLLFSNHLVYRVLSVILFVGALFFILPQSAAAATYCVRADGTAAWVTVSAWTNDGGLFRATTSTPHGYSNGDTVSISGTAFVNGTWIVSNVDATHFTLSNGPAYQVGALGTRVIAAGPVTSASKCMGISTHNVNDLFKPGDVIYLSSGGGNYTATLSVPSSGSVSSPITYSPAVGETVTFSGASSLINITTKSYITVDGLSRLNLTGTTTYGMLVNGCTGCIVKNIAITTTTTNGIFWTNSTGQLSDSSAVAAGFAFRIATGSNVTISNLTVPSGSGTAYFFDSSTVTANNISATNIQNHCVQIRAMASMVLTGNNWDCTDVGKAVSTNDAINFNGNSATNITLTLTDVSIDGANGKGFYGYTGTLNAASMLDDVTISNVDSHGIWMQNMPNLQILNSTISHNGFDGINIDGSSNTVVRNNDISYNAQDGVSTLNSAANVIVEYNDIHHNGANTTGNGDGFTAHASCTNQQVNYNLIHHNWNSGFAVVLSSGGTAYHNVVYSNGFQNTIDQRGGWYQSGTSSWTQKNNIFSGNYPYEVNIAATNTLVANNNQYYHPVGLNGISNESEAFTLNTGTTKLSWASYSPNEAASQYGDPLFVTAGTDFSLQGHSPAVDLGAVISGLTTDYVGNSYYGAPDAGAYEFQPVLIMGTHELDIAGNQRVYSDGNFRNTVSPSGTTAHLEIVPDAGFTTAKTALMDIDISSWEASGTYAKSWTETSDILGSASTDHTVGDLAVGGQYILLVDTVQGQGVTSADCVSGLCTADGAGEIEFTYTGGYPSVSFSLTAYVPPASPAASQSTQQTSSAPSSPAGYHCSSVTPVGQPDLFQINRTGKTAKLYFTPASDNVGNYHVIYGHKSGDERFGQLSAEVTTETNNGVQIITISELNPRTAYAFKVAPVNGCAVGVWSNWLEAKRVANRISVFYRYLPAFLRR